MILWLDDIRSPKKYGYPDAYWAKTAEEAITILQTGAVTFASLDHDLSEMAIIGLAPSDEKTGYDVVRWMEENGVWPSGGVKVHSMNPVGKARMEAVIARAY